VSYSVDVDRQTQQFSGRVSIELINGAPSNGLPDYVIGGPSYTPDDLGTNLQFLSVYSRGRFGSVRVDGRRVSGVATEEEFGMSVATLLVALPPGQSVTVDVDIEGTFDGDYDLTWFRQVLVSPDVVELEVTVDGRTAERSVVNGAEQSGPATFSGELRRSATVAVPE
jgi:hypothetical protein